jgi:capsular polysaccharide biosynthesis protein
LSDAIRSPSLVNLTLALIFALLAAGGAAVLALNRSPLYQSRAAIMLTDPDVAKVPSVGPIVRLDALRRTYAALARTEQVTVPVAAALKIPQGVVANSVTVVVNADSLIMYPTALSGDRKGAQALAQTVSDELIKYVDTSQRADGVPDEKRVTLAIVDRARPGVKISPTANDAVSAAGLGAALGLVLSYVLLQVVTADRRAGRRRRTVEPLSD